MVQKEFNPFFRRGFSLSTKRFSEIYIEFSWVAWSGRGETPVGLARQLRPCRPKGEAAQREPHGKRTPGAESNIPIQRD